MLVRIWFAAVIPVIFIATGVLYYATRALPVAVVGGVLFLAALFAGWYLAARGQKV